MIAHALLAADDLAANGMPARDLHLDVMLGGRSIGLIGTFHQGEDGRIVARRKELEDLGLRVPAGYRPDDTVALAEIPGLAYRYDETRQSIDISVPDTGRLPKVYDAAATASPAKPGGYSSAGAVLNYTLIGSSDGRTTEDFWRAPSLAANLDARVFSAFGVLSQSGLVSAQSAGARDMQALRLETTWSYSDPATMLSYRAGDTISGGLAWTRPIRLGGLQVQRNFGLRPDLITLPLPSVNGSASVPSTVDVFVNGIKTISQEVSGGPFRINNLPILSGNGNANIVLRDASGQQTETTLPFIVSSQLLRPGLFDFSAEIGKPRLNYGLRSSLYAEGVAGSGSLRYGLDERVTLQAHGEATRSLANGGAGAVIGLGALGLLSGAATGSWHDGATGGQAYAAFETRLWNLTFLASTQRTFGGYRDLASVSAAPLWNAGGAHGGAAAIAATPLPDTLTWTRSLLPPRMLDRLSVGFPVPVVGGGLNFGVAQVKDASGARTRIVNASYTHGIAGGGSFYTSVFANLDERKSMGLFAGLSFPLGRDVIASAGASRVGTGLALAVDVAKPIGQEAGSIGWRLRDVEGSSGQRRRSASLAYRGDKGQIEGSLFQSGASHSGTAQLDGAIVATGSGVFLTNRIDDAFAVAKVGVAGVDVLLENRVVARTDSHGNALVPGLRSYQPNRLSIDTRGLPVTALADTTQDVLAPPDRAGIIVDFGVRSVSSSAIVIIHGRDGKPLPAGATGTLELGLRGVSAESASVLIGYDGRAFIENLGPDNLVAIRLNGGECRARFPFSPQEGAQVSVGPVTCQ